MAAGTYLTANGNLAELTGPATALFNLGALGKVADTGTGFALVNGTPLIVSWGAPADGNNHRAILMTTMQVTSGATGGQVTATVTTPDGNTSSPQVYAVNLGGGFHSANATIFNIKAGTTLTVQQATALTGGAATVFCEIWAV